MILAIKHWFELVARNGPTALALGISIGVFIPEFADNAKNWISETVFIFVLGTFLRADFKEIFIALKKPSVSIYFPVFMVIFCPYIAGTLTLMLGGGTEIALAIALAVAAPPASGNAAVARMLGLLPSLSLVTTTCSMLLIPFTAPFILNIFDPTLSITLNPFDMAYRLTLLLGSCISLAILLRKVIPKKIHNNNVAIDGIVILSLLIFACGTMSGMQDMIINDTQIVLSTVLLAYFTNIALQIAGLIAYPGDLKSRVTMGFTCGNRNIGLLWAVLGSGISPTVALFFACAQFPIYTMPKLLHFAFSKLRVTLKQE